MTIPSHGGSGAGALGEGWADEFRAVHTEGEVHRLQEMCRNDLKNEFDSFIHWFIKYLSVSTMYHILC